MPISQITRRWKFSGMFSFSNAMSGVEWVI